MKQGIRTGAEVKGPPGVARFLLIRHARGSLARGQEIWTGAGSKGPPEVAGHLIGQEVLGLMQGVPVLRVGPGFCGWLMRKEGVGYGRLHESLCWAG